ncbi:CPBP family intramembrane metalloprotease [Polycladomyces sp. WAk]|uniref:CPBP family intramembrane metalloprotease n=1 Tax=Polycladomyces zharkentensis TaxID=2807616 RepID=A0ABS2WEW2_9BACL|nr:CPBP family intramembrane metalloprotease [Polycladomyces sp. WAk]
MRRKGETVEIVVLLLLFLPLFVIMWFANRADRARLSDESTGTVWAVFCYLSLVLLHLLVLGMVSLLSLLTSLAASTPIPSGMPGPRIDTAMLEGLNRAEVVVMVTTLAGLIVLLPFVRRLIARVIPIDSSSRVHAAALSLSALIFAYLLTTVALGLDNIAKWNEAAPRSTAGTVSSIWAQDILLALLAMVGVGWLARRRFGDALQRLGIVKPSLRQLGSGVGIGLAMVVVAQIVEQLLYAAGIPVDPHVEKVTEQVIGPLFSSIPGILTLGLAAALGEESLFRGALQPRFGILFTSVLFSFIHSNYGLSISTLIVFLLGLVLGWIRRQHNTVTSMAVHATYNITLGILAQFLR